MKRLIVLLSLAITSLTWAQQPQLDLPRVRLSAGMHLINAQVAATHEQRATGLMYRRSMPTNEGMLFVFPEVDRQCFWMKNTRIALTAAFIDEGGYIVNLADMAPQSMNTHCSVRPVRFVLEMNKGWFAKRGLKAGSKISGPPFQ